MKNYWTAIGDTACDQRFELLRDNGFDLIGSKPGHGCIQKIGIVYFERGGGNGIAESHIDLYENTHAVN